jgi:hypothetical protein
MPSASNAARTSSPANGSSRASSRPAPSITVTSSEPSRRKPCAISAPIGPPPSTRSRPGQLLRRRDRPVVPRQHLMRALHGWHDGCGPSREHNGPRGSQPAPGSGRGADLHDPLSGQATGASHELDPLALQPRLLSRVVPVAGHVVALAERCRCVDGTGDRIRGTRYAAGGGDHISGPDQLAAQIGWAILVATTDEPPLVKELGAAGSRNVAPHRRAPAVLACQSADATGVTEARRRRTRR